MSKTYRKLADIDFNWSDIQPMPLPNTAILVDPKAYDVQYIINPHMGEHVGNVDKKKAMSQWEFIKEQYVKLGLNVHVIPGVENLPDMVFCANQSLPDLDTDGTLHAYMSNMRHDERKEEVPYIRKWYENQGFIIRDHANDDHHFEGMGDALWHLGKRILWGGFGYRTHPEVYEFISDYFHVPVLMLELKNPKLYHLDTCMSVLNETTVLIYPNAFTEDGLAMIHAFFPNVIEANREETVHFLACNAACPDGKHVVIEKACTNTIDQLEQTGFKVIAADTSEFLKSGGSVFCMKLFLWN